MILLIRVPICITKVILEYQKRWSCSTHEVHQDKIQLANLFSLNGLDNEIMIISDVSNTILSNIDRTRTSFFEHRTNSNMFINY